MEHKIIFKALVGSHSHGTNTPESDEDFSGVYVQNNNDILSYGYEEYVQVNKDEKYFEVKRFLDLLMVANPAALELLFAPEDCVLETSPQFKMIYENRHIFLTKKCFNTFAGYAKTQIQKSKGTDKKINWESQRVERKTPLDFCFITVDGKTLPFNKWSEIRGYKQELCGLVNLDHFKDCYAVYYDSSDLDKFKGIVGENSNELRLSSIPKGLYPVATLYYNKDGYTTHCKDWKSYQVWLNERNLNRFHTNVSHGQIYDSKNISHCFRLVSVAKEIALHGDLFVRRTNDVDYLLQIKRGEVPLDKIIEDVERDIAGLEEMYKVSNLPDEVDKDFIKKLLLEIRLYSEPPKKIGVICNTTDDFNEWRNEQTHNPTNSRRNYFEYDNNQYYCIIIGNGCAMCGVTLNEVVYLVSQETLMENKEFWSSIMSSIVE